mmetsp:Transcript_20019/g.40141  ORF Transcript_20019/g.40141 Transcript_20019/m.40141 type:complete len:219 (-) Transcript_20019:175-831(-)
MLEMLHTSLSSDTFPCFDMASFPLKFRVSSDVFLCRAATKMATPSSSIVLPRRYRSFSVESPPCSNFASSWHPLALMMLPIKLRYVKFLGICSVSISIDPMPHLSQCSISMGLSRNARNMMLNPSDCMLLSFTHKYVKLLAFSKNGTILRTPGTLNPLSFKSSSIIELLLVNPRNKSDTLCSSRAPAHSSTISKWVLFDMSRPSSSQDSSSVTCCIST